MMTVGPAAENNPSSLLAAVVDFDSVNIPYEFAFSAIAETVKDLPNAALPESICMPYALRSDP